MTANTPPRLAVLVSATATAGPTVDYALRAVREAVRGRRIDATVDVVNLQFDTDCEEGGVRRRVKRLTRGELEGMGDGRGGEGGGDDGRISVNVRDLDLSGTPPDRRLRRIVAALSLPRADRVIVDPGLAAPTVEELREHIPAGRSTTVELAPVGDPTARRPLLHPGGGRRQATVFATTYLFYLAVAGSLAPFDLITGAISAGVVAVVLSRVAFENEPSIRRTGPRLVRSILFLPYLFYQIAKANVVIAYVILHPRLPVDPGVTTFETDAVSDLEAAMLASAITLTPGTITLDVRGRDLYVHSLTEAARADLAKRRLADAVAFVFGREDADLTAEGEPPGSEVPGRKPEDPR